MDIRDQQELLFRITNKLISSTNGTAAIEKVAKLIVSYASDYCRIVITNGNGQILEIATNHKESHKIQLAKDLYDAYKDMSNVAFGIPTLIKSGKPELIKKITPTLLKKYKTPPSVRKIVEKLELKSYMGVPLRTKKKIVGAITFSSSKPERYYSKSDLAFAGHIAHRVAFALERTYLYKITRAKLVEQRKYQKQLRFLIDASKILFSSLDYKVTLKNVATLAIASLSDLCAIDVVEGETIQNVVIMHRDPQKLEFVKFLRQKLPYTPGAPGIPRVVETGKSEIYKSVTDETLKQNLIERVALKLVKKMGIVSVMLVPMLVRGKVIGVISFVSLNPETHYNESDLTIAEEVASRAALAIENSKLYTDSVAAVRLRDEFISIASHELKTPLTALKMHVQLIERQIKSGSMESADKSLTRVDSQINKLSNLVRDLLNVSRIQQGKLVFNLEDFDLNVCVKDVIETVQETSQNHQIVIVGKTRRQVHGDKERIAQVVMNLLTNAIKYSPKTGKIYVKIGSAKNMAQISVRDSGIGIKKDYLAKIFDLFYRVDTNEAATYPGLGVGLYISDQIVRRHGGQIMVKSRYGKGSEFTFTVPHSDSA